MKSRRVFLQASAGALAAVLAAPRTTLRAQTLSGRRTLITAVVFDERVAACRDFADEAVRHVALHSQSIGAVTDRLVRKVSARGDSFIENDGPDQRSPAAQRLRT